MIDGRECAPGGSSYVPLRGYLDMHLFSNLLREETAILYVREMMLLGGTADSEECYDSI